MGDKALHQKDLKLLLAKWGASGSSGELTSYIASHSSLPGPRGNLELAAAWSEIVEAQAKQGNDSLWALATSLASLSASEAPQNDPREMVAFCGVVGIGAFGAASGEHSQAALALLRCHARDPRWRMREGVAMALQHMLPRDVDAVLLELRAWVEGGDLLEMRAVAAALAEPCVLDLPGIPQAALGVHQSILAAVEACDARRTEPFRVLRKGLGYTLSVIVSRAPESGFHLLERLASSRDADIRWIVKQNLSKRRLAGPHTARVKAIKAVLLQTETEA